jgi:hypothetical protein
MGRHERRASLARYRREAGQALLTYMVPPDDPALDGLLRRAARNWIAALPTRVRSCIICCSGIANGRDVGAVLLSTPDIAKPTSASVCAVCIGCWDADVGHDALSRAAATALNAAIKNGRWLDP